MRDRYASLREGLVGAWIPSISGSGLLLPDLSGQGNNGTLTNMGPEDWVSGQYGRALDFDGVSNAISINSSASLSILDFTISFWFVATYGLDTNLIDKGFNTGNATRIALQWNIFNSYKTRLFYNNSVQLEQSSTISENAWCNIVYTRKANVLSCYFNSRLDGQNVSANSSAIANNDILAIAARTDFAANFYTGQLDDIRIYKRALSEPEIKLLSQEPGVGFKRTRSVFDFGRKPAYLPPTPADYRTVRVKQTEHASLREGLVGAWCPSIEGSGYTLPDLSGQGNNSTLTNMGPEDWVAGEYGRALDFDGNNDYSTIPMNPIFNMPNVKTISCWLYARSFDGAFQFNDIIATDNIAQNDRTWLIGALDADNDNVDAELRIASGGTGGGRSTITTSSEVLTSEKWHHIAATTTDGLITVSDVCLYVDGIKQAVTDVSTGTYTSPLPLTSYNPLQFGLRPGTSADLRWNGQLDDIRIYNRVLSESEIKLLASRPGIGLRPQRRTMYYAPPVATGARRRRILTSMP